jgi:hypothetical protein
MARKVFFSFHHAADSARASQVRNAGVLEGNRPVSDNDWEAVKKGGDKAIQAWIDEQLQGRSCTVVLIGRATAGRKWIDYEIRESWNSNKGLVGIYVHNLKDLTSNQSIKGKNPFENTSINKGLTKLSTVVKAYDPPCTTSTVVYDHIKANLSAWVEEAIKIRQAN